MPAWGNPHEWPRPADPAPQSDARSLILDLAAVHNLLVQVAPWGQAPDARRKVAYDKVAAAHERLIDLVGQS